jgi:DNA-directed RNA polymerase subunit omega
MARVTVEDCLKYIPNHFELSILASHRARQISSGAPLTVERNNDKNAVVSLREIAESTVTPQALRESKLKSYQKHSEMDATERAMADMLASEQGPLPEELAMISATEREVQTLVEESEIPQSLAEEDEDDGASFEEDGEEQ